MPMQARLTFSLVPILRGLYFFADVVDIGNAETAVAAVSSDNCRRKSRRVCVKIHVVRFF